MRRSFSPTVVSDASDTSPNDHRNAAVAARRRLATNDPPHVHFDVTGVVKPGSSDLTKSADLSKKTLLSYVASLLAAPRLNGGLGGKLRFADLDLLLSLFRVDVFGADTLDDMWVSMCECAAYRAPPPFIDDVSAITAVLEQYGAKIPRTRRQLPDGAQLVEHPVCADRDRCMSPTISSTRKASHRSTTPLRRNSPRSAVRHIKNSDSTVFDRLTDEAMTKRQRLHDQHVLHQLDEEQKMLAGCTFTPNVRHQHPQLSHDERHHISGHSRHRGYDLPTKSYLMRTETSGAASRDVHRDDVQDALSGAAVERCHSVRRSAPSFVPQQVPVGYVEAVARLRQSAIMHTQKHERFEESLRGTSHRAQRAAWQEKLNNGTILRIPVPSLGEVVHVRLASPLRKC